MDSFDYVIIGGGAAGSENPPAWPYLLLSPANWGDVALNQTAAERPVPVARGRVLGGGSAINAMVFTRGHRSSYERWVNAGAKGWDFDDLLPFFRRTEMQQDVILRCAAPTGHLPSARRLNPIP